jgi:hypothetical protein
MFKKSENSLISLGVGKKALITKWLDEMGVKNYIINDDFTINGNMHIDLGAKNLIELPNYIQFNTVNGSFFIQNNNLCNLKGCPFFIKSDFSCSRNKLKTLEYFPKVVDGDVFTYLNLTEFKLEEIEKICEIGKNVFTVGI